LSPSDLFDESIVNSPIAVDGPECEWELRIGKRTIRIVDIGEGAECADRFVHERPEASFAAFVGGLHGDIVAKPA
jgi:hypothetical protein